MQKHESWIFPLHHIKNLKHIKDLHVKAKLESALKKTWVNLHGLPQVNLHDLGKAFFDLARHS
jgi:hypothetical protein